MARKSKYLEKKITFGSTTVTLFSLDGVTWSSRKEELQAILDRHEQEKASFGGQIKGGPQIKSAGSEAGEDEEEEYLEVSDEEESEEDYEEEPPAAVKPLRAAKKAAPAPAPAPKAKAVKAAPPAKAAKAAAPAKAAKAAKAQPKPAKKGKLAGRKAPANSSDKKAKKKKVA